MYSIWISVFSSPVWISVTIFLHNQQQKLLLNLVICFKLVILVHECHSMLCYVIHNSYWAGRGWQWPWITHIAHLLAKYQHRWNTCNAEESSIVFSVTNSLSCFELIRADSKFVLFRGCVMPFYPEQQLLCAWYQLRPHHQRTQKPPISPTDTRGDPVISSLHSLQLQYFFLVSVKSLQEFQVNLRSRWCIMVLKTRLWDIALRWKADVRYPLFFSSCKLELPFRIANTLY